LTPLTSAILADKSWKNCERKIAALFGTKRIPPAVFGQRADRGDQAPDAETDLLCLQIKSGYAFPGYLRDWLGGINRNTPAGKTGVLVWHPTGAKFTDSLVLLRAVDFSALVARVGAIDSPPAHAPDTPADT
jgi:hypothetical protein